MPPGVTSCQFLETPISISFSGSGFMATYQLGVAQCLLNYAPWILKTAPRVLGASAGSLVAAAVVCEIDFVSIRDEMLHFAKKVKEFRLGPLSPSINVFHWLEQVLLKHIPEKAHKLACGRLAVAMTRLEDGKHLIMTEYHSKEDVVQALLCSCYVPGYCGMIPPSFKGIYCVDGGFTGMQPVLSQCPTLTVSPFSGDVDICPADAPCLWEMVVSGTTLKANGPNCGRVINALYPVTLESLEEAFDNGYKDAINFLLKNDLAPCLTLHNVKPLLESAKRDTDGEKKARKYPDHLHRPQEHESKNLDFIQNVLLSNMMTNETMVGVTGKLFLYLLLPLLFLIFTVMQSWHRLQFWFRDSPQWIFWTWAGLKHFIVFFYRVCISTIRKNIDDRIDRSFIVAFQSKEQKIFIYILLLLKNIYRTFWVKIIMMMFMWFKFHVEVEGPPRTRKHFGPTVKTCPLHETKNEPKSLNQFTKESKKLN
ncbi:patatin-like phospholipase domain-containing protein 2 [Boleophthalmus pectinirostris]|uniref:patatin-like phospholipase domain-containing protein 2 n=1 Tax=Boleophthalmus pectinirostris TaxID=150288 RepID=UPI00242FF718|nr:patatin-like phospholipase domain-containing protein 2 [Boleophthalmus pectinirostris]